MQASLLPQGATGLGQASLIGAAVLHLGASGLLFAPWPGQNSSITLYPVDFIVAPASAEPRPVDDQIAALVQGLGDLPAGGLNDAGEEDLLEEALPVQVPPPKPVRRIVLPEVAPEALYGTNGLYGASGQTSSESAYRAHIARRLRAAQHARPTAVPVPGSVTIGFVVTANGQVEASWIDKSSGNGALNRAALAILRQASPFEPLPADLGKTQLIVKQALSFTTP